MLRNYIKIAWKVLLRRKFFTFVSLFGISFTLLVLTVVVAYVDRVCMPAKPGSKLDRCLYVDRVYAANENNEIEAYPSYHFLNRYVGTMDLPEAVSIHENSSTTVSYVRSQKIEFQLKHTDAVFWDIMEFEFIEGSAFTEEAVSNADHVAVITERTSQQVFGTESPIGEYIETTDGNYRVIGVIPHQDIAVRSTYADIYVPISLSEGAMNVTRVFANCSGVILTRSESDMESVKEEFARTMLRVREDHMAEWDSIGCCPTTQAGLIGRRVFGYGSEHKSSLALVGIIALMILFMLFPAINLININVSRIIERSSEIGVRKAFGASSKVLVGQFVVENIFLTLIGGALALVLAYVVLDIITESGLIPFGKCELNLRVFIYSLLLCMFFGLLSGVLPAYRMSRLHPVDALKGSDL